MTKTATIFGFILTLFLCSCSTYSTFYSKTHQSINSERSSDIHRLDLSHQNLNSVPEDIETLPSLKMLNLSNNPELNLSTAFINIVHPEDLEVLVLDSLSIRQLPESIKRFTKLKQLSLVGNPDIDLEHTFSLISDLPIRFLNLKGNGIRKLPESITKLQYLKDLNLSYNRLTDELSYTYLGNLPELYSLWLDHNDLNELPITIGALSQIHYLYIDHNNLEVLPKEMGTMDRVWVIHAGFNHFKELPEAFIKMKRLLMVYINNNDITSFSTKFETEKHSLKGLLLVNNPISPEERLRFKNVFDGFFLLSFEQKKY